MLEGYCNGRRKDPEEDRLDCDRLDVRVRVRGSEEGLVWTLELARDSFPDFAASWRRLSREVEVRFHRRVRASVRSETWRGRSVVYPNSRSLVFSLCRESSPEEAFSEALDEPYTEGRMTG